MIHQLPRFAIGIILAILCAEAAMSALHLRFGWQFGRLLYGAGSRQRAWASVNIALAMLLFSGPWLGGLPAVIVLAAAIIGWIPLGLGIFLLSRAKRLTRSGSSK